MNTRAQTGLPKSGRIGALLKDPGQWALAGPSWSDPVANPHRYNDRISKIRHTHAYPEFMFVIQGTGLYSIGSQLYRYRPGAVLILPPHIEHAAGHPPDIRSFTHIWISVPHDIFVNLYVRRQGSLSLTFRRNWFFPLKETGLGRIIYDGVPQTPDDGRRLRLLAVLCEVIGKLLAPTQASTGEPTGARQFQKIEAVCRHIEETGGKGLCLTELARLSGISKFHLLRVFKRQVGCTVHQFINRHRLQTMNRLIEKGTPRKVIAQELGFSCPAAFSRWAAATSLFK